MNRNIFKRDILPTMICVAISTGSAIAEEGIEEVVVTGTQLSNKRVIEAKWDTSQISDSIAADDIASLPDFNMAEALSRVPGISTDLDNGEDRFVAIRGMNKEYNFSTLDGLVIPSSDEATKAVLYDTVPSGAAKRVDVYKSFSADMDGEAIGGRIDMKTRSAFDRDDALANISGDLGYWENKDDGPEDLDNPMRFKGVYTDTFGENKNWGIAFAGSYNNNPYVTVAPTYSGSRGYTIPEGSNEYMPDWFSQYLYTNERERIGLLGKLEFRNDEESLYAYMTGYRFSRLDSERRDLFVLRTRPTYGSADESGGVDTNVAKQFCTPS